MMKNKTISEKVKTELTENILNSKVLKIGKYTILGLGTIYALGFAFKVLAFTKSNLNEFRRTLKS